ncbi:MAG TPA: DUF6094 domain-containing protein [Candidatus Binatia bacterium]|nr:DUF6094 domain-containing protein [Candidatus Binatia bacterium]
MRNQGRLKLGYFPLPPSEGPRIRACLFFPPQASVLDPCAGTGAALLQVTEGAPVTRYAIELDADRAEACARFGINTVHSNTIEVSGKSQQVSLLYCNPPYDFECGSWDNRRLEYVFLQHCYRWLVPGGVLVFVVPQKALDSCNRILSDRFANIQVFKLSDPESEKYDQIVIFGIRKDQSDRNSNNTQFMLRQLNWGRLPIEPLPDGGIPNGTTFPRAIRKRCSILKGSTSILWKTSCRRRLRGIERSTLSFPMRRSPQVGRSRLCMEDTLAC